MSEQRWTPHQQHAIDCLACRHGIPTRRMRYYAAPPHEQRFDTRHLAAKLARALHGVRS